MKLEIFDEKKVKEQEPIRLKLIKSDIVTKFINGINLVSVNKDGVEIGDGIILSIKLDGSIYRWVGCKINGIQTHRGKIFESIGTL